MRISRKPERTYAGSTVLVTGGASGLGRELVTLFLAEGAHVIVGDLHAERPSTLPDDVQYLVLDVRSDDDWAAALSWVEHHVGRLDVLVNNAGIAVGGRIDATAIADWERALSINLMGVVRGSRSVVPLMKRQGCGQIVNTASLAGLVHAPAMATYNATKAAVVAVSETMRHELAPFGIEVNVICPSFFRTNLAQSLAGQDTAMETSARKLIDGAPRSAAQVARAAFRGMTTGQHVIVTDTDGRIAYAAKRYLRPVYDAGMVSAGRRVAAGKEAEPAALRALNALAGRLAR